jgi:hypothetical protein
VPPTRAGYPDSALKVPRGTIPPTLGAADIRIVMAGLRFILRVLPWLLLTLVGH